MPRPAQSLKSKATATIVRGLKTFWQDQRTKSLKINLHIFDCFAFLGQRTKTNIMDWATPPLDFWTCPALKKDLPRPSMVWKTKTKIGNLKSHHLGESHMNCEPVFTCLQCLQIYRSTCHHIGFLFSLQDLSADSIRVCRGKHGQHCLGKPTGGTSCQQGQRRCQSHL